MINFFGFFLDWLITRNWRPIFMLLAVPAIMVVTLFIMGIWGSLMDETALAEKYLAIGERELGDAGKDWAFDLRALNNDLAEDTSEKDPKNTIPRFTEAVFQRIKQLQGDNPRATYVIGAIMGQKGAIANAIYLMKSIAPDNREGYLPAHAWLANLMLLQQPFPKDQLPKLRHHLALGTQWDSAPAHLLAAEVQQLRVSERNEAAALELLRTAAEKQPDSEAIFRLAVQMNNTRIAEETAAKVLPRLLDLIKEGTATTADRIALADVLYFRRDFDAARGALEEGLKVPGISDTEIKELSRALSDFYRLRFSESLKVSTESWSADVGLLDQAMRIDPTNPRIAEEVAKLARIGGDSPPDALIKQLNEFLAQGNATPLTHAWIAEAYILRNELPKAMEHLRNVITRMPNSGDAHNNLAYAMALSQPKEQLGEALEHAQAAVSINPSSADFHDTLGFVLMKLGRVREAITEFEVAIQIDPKNISFHERVVEAYTVIGVKEMVDAHLDTIKKLKGAAPVKGKP